MRRLALVLLATTATAETAPADDRPLHGSIGAGGTLIFTGEQGKRTRADVAIDLKWHSRYGGIVGWRAFDQDRKGLVTAGIVYEGGAARPRLVLDLIAEVGADLDQKAPVLGAGIRTTITIIGPLGVALHSGAYFIYDGIDDSRLQLESNALIVARW